MADDKDKREIYVDNNLVGYVRNKFQEAETSKIYDEKAKGGRVGGAQVSGSGFKGIF